MDVLHPLDGVGPPMSATRKEGERHDNDNYPTPRWAIDVVSPHMLDALPIDKPTIFDPGAGEGALLQGLHRAGHMQACLRGLELREDAAALCREQGFMVHGGDWLADSTPLGGVGAVVINPPYGGRLNLSQQFIKLALDRLSPGSSVWALLRVNWLLDGEVRYERQTWLRGGPGLPDLYGLDRRPSFTGDGHADATTYAWMHWIVGRHQDLSTFRTLTCPRPE